MGVALELAGLALVAGTFYAFVGPIAQGDPAGWPLFWSCAAGAVAVIVCRGEMRRRARGRGEPRAGSEPTT